MLRRHLKSLWQGALKRASLKMKATKGCPGLQEEKVNDRMAVQRRSVAKL
jgi:hypothetical protein